MIMHQNRIFATPSTPHPGQPKPNPAYIDQYGGCCKRAPCVAYARYARAMKARCIRARMKRRPRCIRAYLHCVCAYLHCVCAYLHCVCAANTLRMRGKYIAYARKYIAYARKYIAYAPHPSQHCVSQLPTANCQLPASNRLPTAN